MIVGFIYPPRLASIVPHLACVWLFCKIVVLRVRQAPLRVLFLPGHPLPPRLASAVPPLACPVFPLRPGPLVLVRPAPLRIAILNSSGGS